MLFCYVVDFDTAGSRWFRGASKAFGGDTDCLCGASGIFRGDTDYLRGAIRTFRGASATKSAIGKALCRHERKVL